jgi:glycosyltransferase involved in cell wall biosynthesis
MTAGAKPLSRLLAVPRMSPYSVSRFADVEMRRLLRERAAAGTMDALVCDVFTAVNLSDLRVDVLLNHENVEHTILHRYCSVERNPAKKLYAWLEFIKMRRWEAAACRRSVVSLACSAVDAAALAKLHPSAAIVIAPNIVDTATPDGTSTEDPWMILFQGGMDWFPNRDAAAFFITDIYPRVLQLAPQARLTIAGRNPSADFVRRFVAVPGVTITGTVPDMRAIVSRAAIAIAPLRIGSGTRLKILEAAALGKAVVSTTIGAEGLSFRDGKEIVLADDPKAFAHAVATLLRDPTRRREIGCAAKRKTAQEYGMGALREAVSRALRQLNAAACATYRDARLAGGSGPR